MQFVKFRTNRLFSANGEDEAMIVQISKSEPDRFCFDSLRTKRGRPKGRREEQRRQEHEWTKDRGKKK